jgi:chemotaxis protein histidine kinase CheA
MPPRNRPARVPAGAMAAAGRRHVVFGLAGVPYLLDASQVRRSLPAPASGAAEVLFLGQSYPLVDLRALFRLPESTACGRMVLLVQGTSGRAGLVVDELLELAIIDETVVVPLPAPFQGVERRWFAGLVGLGGRVLVLLRLEAILAAQTVLPPARPPRAVTVQ